MHEWVHANTEGESLTTLEKQKPELPKPGRRRKRLSLERREAQREDWIENRQRLLVPKA